MGSELYCLPRSTGDARAVRTNWPRIHLHDIFRRFPNSGDDTWAMGSRFANRLFQGLLASLWHITHELTIGSLLSTTLWPNRLETFLSSCSLLLGDICNIDK